MHAVEDRCPPPGAKRAPSRRPNAHQPRGRAIRSRLRHGGHRDASDVPTCTSHGMVGPGQAGERQAQTVPRTPRRSNVCGKRQRMSQRMTNVSRRGQCAARRRRERRIGCRCRRVTPGAWLPGQPEARAAAGHTTTTRLTRHVERARNPLQDRCSGHSRTEPDNRRRYPTLHLANCGR